MDTASWLLVKGVLNVCKMIGYQNCARMAAATLGRRIVQYSISGALSSVGVPMKLVNCAVSAAPYAPAMVVLASGGPTGIATKATFIVLSQVTDYLMVVAVRTALQSGAKAAFRVVKYAVFTRGRPRTKALTDTINAGLEGGWLLVVENEEGDDFEMVQVEVDVGEGEGGCGGGWEGMKLAGGVVSAEDEALMKRGLQEVEEAVNNIDEGNVQVVAKEDYKLYPDIARSVDSLDDFVIVRSPHSPPL